ncbi:hypothetical protein [Streptomyces sp. NPDC002467]|uniref:hypothetical protein n=1 Tax=Streptomyces sp. NPDC002467 TaxID=3364647 RepID=UPI0036C5B53F
MTGLTEPKPPWCHVLSDLLPSLRFGDPHQLGLALNDARLPDTWWNDTPLSDAIATTGAAEIAQRAAHTLTAHWPHLTLATALPQLCFCPEGQHADLHTTIGHAASADEEALTPLVLALLRPFFTGGRDLAQPVTTAPDTAAMDEHDRDVAVLTTLLTRLLLADAPPAIRAAADTLRTWAQHPGHDSDTDAASPAPSPAVADTAMPTAVSALTAHPLATLDLLVGTWNERQLAIAAGRIFAQSRTSLESLGEQFGVSRERVRQIQVELEKNFHQWLHSDDGQPLLDHLLAVQEHLGPVAIEETLRAIHPAHEQSVAALDLPLWQVIAALLPERTWTSGWLVQGDLDQRLEQTRTELAERCTSSAPTWSDVVELLAQQGIRDTDADAWLQAVKGFRVVEGHLLPWGRSISDRAEAVLTLVGHPLSMEELYSRLDDTTALASLRNQIQSDDRFLRRARDLYGLRRWGGTAYLGIREMINRELANTGGQAPIEDIVTTLCSQFDVSEKSVRAYLAAPEYDRFQRGWVRLATPEDPALADYQPRREVAQTRRCFQTGQGTWWYRLDVNGEHLRGSGFTIPTGFAAHLGLVPGGRLELSHAVGTTHLVWRNQPACGSLRTLLERIEAAEGDHVFLAVKGGHLKALRLAETDEHDLTGTQRALRLMALSGQILERDMPAVLGQRVGLNDATTMDDVLTHLRARGDRDILELLSPQYPAALDDAPAAPDPADTSTPEPARTLEPAPAPETAPVPDEQSTNEPAAETHQLPGPRDPAWDAEIIPLLDPDSEADLIDIAHAVAARGKAAPVFGYELGDGGWPADFAWDQDPGMVAIVSCVSRAVLEAERRDRAYQVAGWTIRDATDWLTHLDELLARLPDAPAGSWNDPANRTDPSQQAEDNL